MVSISARRRSTSGRPMAKRKASTSRASAGSAVRAGAKTNGRPEHRLHMVKVYQHGPGAIRDKDTARRIVGILERHGWLRRLPVGAEVEGKPRRDAWEVVRP